MIEKMYAANGQNTYVYYFVEESNDPDRLADHGYDLGFVLGNVEEDRAKDIPSAWKLSEIMQQMWVNFAKTGNEPTVTKVADMKGKEQPALRTEAQPGSLKYSIGNKESRGTQSLCGCNNNRKGI